MVEGGLVVVGGAVIVDDGSAKLRNEDSDQGDERRVMALLKSQQLLERNGLLICAQLVEHSDRTPAMITPEVPCSAKKAGVYPTQSLPPLRLSLRLQ